MGDNINELKAMQHLTEIQQQLKRGDKARIAELTDSSLDMVLKVLKGQRSCRTPKGKSIVRAAKSIIQQRERMSRRFRQSQAA